jgi:hypothetical protein
MLTLRVSSRILGAGAAPSSLADSDDHRRCALAACPCAHAWCT